MRREECGVRLECAVATEGRVSHAEQCVDELTHDQEVLTATIGCGPIVLGRRRSVGRRGWDQVRLALQSCSRRFHFRRRSSSSSSGRHHNCNRSLRSRSTRSRSRSSDCREFRRWGGGARAALVDIGTCKDDVDLVSSGEYLALSTQYQVLVSSRQCEAIRTTCLSRSPALGPSVLPISSSYSPHERSR